MHEECAEGYSFRDRDRKICVNSPIIAEPELYHASPIAAGIVSNDVPNRRYRCAPIAGRTHRNYNAKEPIDPFVPRNPNPLWIEPRCISRTLPPN